MSDFLTKQLESARWQAFQNGSEEAYTALYKEYASLLFNYGLKITPNRSLVKDCMQDLFYNLWQHRRNLAVPDSVKHYLMGALRKELYKKFERTLTHDTLPEEYIYIPVCSSEQEWLDLEHRQSKQESLFREVNKLPDRQREAVFLRYYENMDFEEVATIMGITQRAVYKLIYKAIDRLQQSPVIKVLTILAVIILCSSLIS